MTRFAYYLLSLSIWLATVYAVVVAVLPGEPQWLFDAALLIGLVGAWEQIARKPDGSRRVMLPLVVGVGLLILGFMLDTRYYLHPYMGYGLASLALIYWLLRRFSTVSEAWYELSLRITPLLMALAMLPLIFDGGVIIAPVTTPILILIIAGHARHGLEERRANPTLTVPWVALTVSLWIGVGLVAGIAAYPPLRPDVTGTLIESVSANWIRFATLSALFAMGNQITADLHGEERRITGWSAYWLIAFGTIIGGVILLCAGVVEVYLNYLDTPSSEIRHLLQPLMALCRWAIAGGALIYALQFFMRRPPGLLSSDSEPRRRR